MRTPTARLHLLLALSLLLGCNQESTAPTPLSMEWVGPVPTIGVPGFRLLDTLRLKVTDPSGAPWPGVRVDWNVREGGGSIHPVNDSTDAEGMVLATWTLGPGIGPNEVRASIVAGPSLTLRAQADVFRASYVVGDFMHSGCALLSGAIWCWGAVSPVHGPATSDYERDFTDNDSPALLDGARNYVALSEYTGGRICALDDLGLVWCTRLTGSPLPLEQVPGLPPLKAFRGSSNGGACGVARDDGIGWCWISGAPAPVSDTLTFKTIDQDWTGRLLCGLLTDSTAACWGDVPAGNGSSTPSPSPVAVSGGHHFSELAVGSNFACGRTAGYALWCWGQSFMGGANYLAPQLVATNVYAVRATEGWILVSQIGGTVSRLRGPDFGPDPFGEASGLSDAPVEGFAADGVGCVIRVGGAVYCVGAHWNTSTHYFVEEYLPVQPVVALAPRGAVSQ